LSVTLAPMAVPLHRPFHSAGRFIFMMTDIMAQARTNRKIPCSIWLTYSFSRIVRPKKEAFLSSEILLLLRILWTEEWEGELWDGDLRDIWVNTTEITTLWGDITQMSNKSCILSITLVRDFYLSLIRSVHKYPVSDALWSYLWLFVVKIGNEHFRCQNITLGEHT
jgi:hypothetical protein